MKPSAVSGRGCGLGEGVGYLGSALRFVKSLMPYDKCAKPLGYQINGSKSQNHAQYKGNLRSNVPFY